MDRIELETSYRSNSRDFETCSDLSGKAALSAAQDDVKEFLRCRDRRNVLPSGLHLDFKASASLENVVVDWWK
jgi:hypothetical protein